MDELALGIIGCGNIFGLHAKYLPELTGVRMAALADTDPDKRAGLAERYAEVPVYEDGYQLMNSGKVDAVLIATPHYDHPVLAAAAMERGLHVLVEKPVAVTAHAAERINQVHRQHPELVYAAMFQQRARPVHQRIGRLCRDGTLGPIQRVNYVITTWFRSQIYYDSGGWRATWRGEGGGVLLNQCPHNLDLMQWWLGMPSRVAARAGLGKYHDIEVEDEITALLEYPNGAIGTFATTTGEAPGLNRLEIVGDNATLIHDGSDTIRLIENATPTSTFSRTTDQSFATPATTTHTIDVGGRDPGHRGITANFIAAIRDGVELIAPAEQGLHGLELGNAMLMSGLTGEPVDLPTPRQAFDRMIADLAANSTHHKRRPAAEAQADMTRSL